MDLGSTPPSTPRLRARVARRLASLSPWALLTAIVAVALVYGLEPWVLIVAAFSLVYAAVHRVLSKRIEERLDRKPELQLVIADSGAFSETIISPVLPPWPFDTDGIVARELNRLNEEAEAGEKFARRPGAARLLGYDPLAVRPSAAEYERARDRFANELDEYEQALRIWLERYRQAADARGGTFELPLHIISASSGAYAEDVVLAIDLPTGFEVVEEWPTISPPPEPPSYIPPTPRSIADIARVPFEGIGPSLVRPFAQTVSVPKVSLWEISNDRRRLTARLGNIHHATTVELGEQLLLRAPAPGRHTLTWTLHTKNGRRHCTGTLDLVVPDGGERPPFRRLEGIVRYPDVPFVDEGGEVVTVARTSDPPTEPPALPEGGDVLDRLAHMGAQGQWLALGLRDDPDDADEVRIERIEPVGVKPRGENHVT